ncbi:hypothetical protein EYB25_004118 [Talaromyces marneffei]|nr:uncharacterized protein EYB26_004795 [Talaromyces marneffei]KAE8552739.1 hypothetical protein EYB25_004118 [Talaromyces marneffei]QGA17125.1 hypothetical protein EYB26_004795 [Talaromyces marneffei]
MTTSTTATTSVTSTTGINTASATSTSSSSHKESSPSSDSTLSSGSGNWFSTHWRWVVMIIVLAVGFSVLAAVAVWLKKRFDARQPGLYHGDDHKGGASGGSLTPAAGFFAGSLRNLSRSNVNSTRASTDNSSNNVAVASKVPKMQQQPSMSTTSFSNRRSSTLTNSVMSNGNSIMNNNGHEMWGPNQARNFENIAPVEEPVFRNSMATAAAAAAFGGGAAGTEAESGPEAIGIATTTANDSRTDLSSVGTGGGRATPRNQNRLSGQSASASNLHHQHQMQQQATPLLREAQSHRELQTSPTPVSQIHD